MFDVFILVFLRFRFNKNARVEKIRELSVMWRKFEKGNEILKDLGNKYI